MKESLARENVERFVEEMKSIGYGPTDIVKMIEEKGEE